MPHFLTVYLSDVRRLTAAGQSVRRLRVAGYPGKRACDLLLAFLVLVPVIALASGIAVWLLCRQGRPLFFVSERIGQSGRPFQLLKFRTMLIAADAGMATGGDKSDRITQPGRWLRMRRLDELPQLWNILRGDLSFVGPRPPLRRYVERHRPI